MEEVQLDDQDNSFEELQDTDQQKVENHEAAEDQQEIQYETPHDEPETHVDISLDTAESVPVYIPNRQKSVDIYGSNVRVTNPTIQESRMKKHVLYTINGSDSQGGFSVERRYKDFESLRNILNFNWPGCFIPGLPSKSLSKNFNSDFIETRRKIFEEFLKVIFMTPYLQESGEFQSFLRSPVNYVQIAQDHKINQYSMILANYQRYFSDFYDAHPDQGMESTLIETRDLLRQHNALLDRFERTGVGLAESFTQFVKNISRFNEQLQQLDNEVMGEFRAQKLTSIDLRIGDDRQNPYIVILDWIRSEIIHNNALIDCIHKRQEYQARLEHCRNKYAQDQAKLMKVQAGKKTLGQIFSKKSKESRIIDLEIEIKQMGEQIQQVERILNIITSRIVELEIPRFKDMKRLRYHGMLSLFSQESQNEFEVFRNIASKIELVI